MALKKAGGLDTKWPDLGSSQEEVKDYLGPEMSQSLKTTSDFLSEHHVIHTCCSLYVGKSIPWTVICIALLRLFSKTPIYLQEFIKHLPNITMNEAPFCVEMENNLQNRWRGVT